MPIDLLGGGYVVAPPSRVEKGEYQFIEGSLDDLGILPTLQSPPAQIPIGIADIQRDIAMLGRTGK